MYLLKILKEKFIKYFVKIHIDTLCDLVPFVQIGKREKHLWGSAPFSSKVTLPHGCF